MSHPTAMMVLPFQQDTEEDTHEMQVTAFLVAQSVEDLRLAERVEQALWATAYKPLRGVEISVHSKCVILQGRVPSHYLKQLAQATALAVAGTHRVCNDLTVTNGVAQERCWPDMAERSRRGF